MTYRLEQYRGGARRAVFCESLETVQELDHPHRSAVQEGNELCFLEDGARFLLNAKSEPLRDGDIIQVNEFGILTVQYQAACRSATIFLDGRCNSNCVMCPNSDGERRYAGDLEAEVDFIGLLPRDLQHCVVTGGEPTLGWEGFVHIMQLLADSIPSTRVLLLTNGRIFASHRHVQTLADYCPPYLTAGVPLHGASAATHDSITQSLGSFKQTIAGIRNLMSLGIAVEIRITVSQLNVLELLALAHLVITLPSPPLHVVFMGLEVRGNCAKNRSTVYMSPDISFAAARAAIDCLIEGGIDVLLYNYPLCAVPHGYWPLCRRSISPHKVIYDAACEQCAAKAGCGGWFESTYRAMRPGVFPIRGS